MAAETALKLVETDEVKQKSITIAEEARLIKVVDSSSYEKAGYMFKALGSMLKEIDEKCDKNISLWHQGHKNAVAEKKEYYEPVESARRYVKGLMSDYEKEQERIRLAEQKRLDDIARKAEEERLLQEAIIAKEEAKVNGATPQEAAQEAEAVISQPVYIPPVVLPKATPKVHGVVFREIWKAQVVDLRALVNAVASGKAPIQALKADDFFLGQQARSLKSALNLPGVKSYSERV